MKYHSQLSYEDGLDYVFWLKQGVSLDELAQEDLEDLSLEDSKHEEVKKSLTEFLARYKLW